ncbi:MAG: hypothetical protein HXP02_01225 [Streptococcus sp.]|jgi:hypothetical protein|uniref:Uncharacterized protein n=1 Tax=Streptococcus parasanguinis TaxID=1318 RepID=A0A6A8V7U2_STRPA|nr:hypothetical protein [Streptococcus parasanguinis]MBF1723359.1 hypothetical protein [Streptococcus sp.]MTR66888.1 hypothetical protein [Streptococcus parasanguinis]MTS01624.1 hypothetical protein [Streptococcus parasanguinis]
MKNKKASIIIAIIMLIVGSIIFMRLKKSSEKIYSDDIPSKIRKIQLFDKDKFVFVAVNNYSDGVVLYGENYVTTVSSNTLYTGNYEKIPPIGNEEYYQIISYDIKSDKEKIIKFDLYKLLGKNNLYRAPNSAPQTYLQNGDDYLTLNLEKLNEHDLMGDNIRPILFLANGRGYNDISEKEMEKINQKQQQYFKNQYDWFRGGIYEQIDANLAKYNLSINENSLYPMNYKPSQINVSGSNFSKLYPELEKDIKYLKALYFRPKQYNEREWFDKIIHWFAPEGQDVMELYATDETTGEKTQIHSYDEFVSWIKTHPKQE